MTEPNDGDDGVPPEGLRCSFCGKDQYHLRKLIAGPNAYICADCVEVCVDIMADDRAAQEPGIAPAGSHVVGSIVVARCSLCRTPTPATVLVTIDTRGALCETCVAVVESVLRDRALGNEE